MFALLGEISFKVIGSPEVFESSRRFDYAEHRVVEDRPRLQWLAADLESITLAMLFHISFTDPAAQLAALLAAANDHQARALVLGNGVFRGFFVVESVATSDIQLGADAAPVAIRVRAGLREWAPGSEFDPAAPPRLASVPLGIAPMLSAIALPPRSSEPTFPRQAIRRRLSISPESLRWSTIRCPAVRTDRIFPTPTCRRARS
jgi:phage protein U